MNKCKDPTLNKLLTIIDYTPDVELEDATITNVILSRKDYSLAIDILLPKVVKIKTLLDFKSSVKDGLISKNACKNVTFSFSYKDKEISKETLEEYYRYTLDLLKNKNITFLSLDKFQVEFQTNAISLLIGGDSDKEAVEPLFMFVKKSLDVLGLDFVKFELIKKEGVVSIDDSIKESAMDAYNDAVFGVRNFKSNKEEEKKTYRPEKRVSRINGVPQLIANIPSTEEGLLENKQKNGNNYFLIEGVIVSSKIDVKKGTYRIYEGIIKDKSGSIIIKTFISEGRGENEDFYSTKASAGNKVRVYGLAAYDDFSRDYVVKIYEIISYGISKEGVTHSDNSKIKRVELHAHSMMTSLDSVLTIEQYVKRAKEYGHLAIALTDKNSVQGLGKFDDLSKKAGIKPIYGLEGYYLNESTFNPALSNEDIDLRSATFVVYDLETTGINTTYNEIIEIGAIKVENGEITDEFSSLINPRRLIPEDVMRLTHITNDDVRNSPFIEEVLPKFMNFCEGAILVGHNVGFDNGHLYHNLKRLNMYKGKIPTIDTMQLARCRYSNILKKYGLDDLVKAFNITLDNHHRAEKDAYATCEVFIKMLNNLLSDGITNYNLINTLVNEKEVFKLVHPYHITLLSTNRTGLVNLNRLVSDAHCDHLAKTPRFLKKVINKYREGLLVGSSCVHGEVFEMALNKDYDDLLEVIDFYDYIEVQPLSVYSHLVTKKRDEITFEKLQNVVNRIIKAAKEKNKIVVATGDIHELDIDDKVYRNIIYDKPLKGGGIHELSGIENLPAMHYRNTDDMLKEFDFLNPDLAYEIVVTNTNLIADMVEQYNLFPTKLYAPGDDFMEKYGIPSAIEDLKKKTYEEAERRYGNPLPQIVIDRLDKELGSIIKYGYGSIYYIAYLLVKHSRDAGYVVGSRGSVGSSLVATFMKITEVNSLATHYYCPKCKFSAFKYTKEELEKYTISNEEKELQEFFDDYDCGLDLPKRKCPHCGEDLIGDGCNIPFETFLGFKGDKVPDIDLNFSGEYQANAHSFCREIFGVENTFRGGTIGTIKERTAENYVKDYYIKRGRVLRNCEIGSLATNITGIKRQTGQHPGGIVVVPQGIDINEVTPVQYPADDDRSDWKTTHVDYHKFEANLLKLDILGHDDPTMMRFLMNFVDDNPDEFPFRNVEDIPLNDDNVMKMFSGIDVLGVTYDDVYSRIGSTGLPEFGTNLTKSMLLDIKPKTISDLIRISGLSHGTNVWNGNEKEYFFGRKNNEPIPINKLICCRDDIMSTLIAKGLSSIDSFKIMEGVRKGRGLTPDQEKVMKLNNVEDWYIDCCKMIKYLFPKAHATAYVIMALRIAWFKFYKPLYFYSGFFSKRSKYFEIETFQGGVSMIKERVQELEKKYGNFELSEEEENSDQSFGDDGGSAVKQKKLLNILKVALEMEARGYTFKNVNINKSDALNFKIEGNSLIIPFVAIDSFGDNTAKVLVERRGNSPFTSIADVMRRGRISNSLFEKLFQLGAFEGLPSEDDIGLFKFNRFDDTNE